MISLLSLASGNAVVCTKICSFQAVIFPSSFNSRCLVVVPGELFPGTRGDGIGDGNGRSVDIAKVVSDRRNNWHGDGACCADDDGPEEGGTLAGCPAAVLEGSLPEEGSGRHDGL